MARHVRSIPPAGIAPWPLAGVVFVLAAALQLAWSTQRTLWQDESASIVAATRSWAGLGDLVAHIDLVHVAYYAVLHVWFDVVGYSPLALRAPSAVAAAAAAALLVPLVARFGGVPVAVTAAAVYSLTPSVLLAATNGRSQSFEMLAAVGATLLVVVGIDRVEARRRGQAAAWIGYAAVAYVGVLLNLWFVFVIAGHCVAIAVRPWSRRARSGPLVAWAGSALVAVGIATVPFALRAVAQSSQISFMRVPTAWQGFVTVFRDVSASLPLVHQAPAWSWSYAVSAWGLAVVGVVEALRRRQLRGIPVFLPWVVLPPIGLIAVTLSATPTLSGRYLAFCLPGFAALVAFGLSALVRYLHGVIAVVAAVALVVLGGQAWVQVRWGDPTTFALSSVADEIRAERVQDPSADAGIIYGNMVLPSIELRVDYPRALRGVRDLTRTPRPAADRFWPDNGNVGAAVQLAASEDVVWYVGMTGGAETTAVEGAMRGVGLVLDETHVYGDVVLLEYRKA